MRFYSFLSDSKMKLVTLPHHRYEDILINEYYSFGSLEDTLPFRYGCKESVLDFIKKNETFIIAGFDKIEQAINHAEDCTKKSDELNNLSEEQLNGLYNDFIKALKEE